MSRYDVFVSAVSSECGAARDLVARSLRDVDLKVGEHKDFEGTPAGVSLVQHLEELVAQSDEVVAIVGTRAGWVPPEDSVAEIAHLLPPGMTEASATQWEVIFALHHGKRVRVCLASERWEPDEARPTDMTDAALQATFRAWLFGQRDIHRVTCDNDHAAALAALRAYARIGDFKPEGAFFGTIAGVLAGVFMGVLVYCGVVPVWPAFATPAAMLVSVSAFLPAFVYAMILSGTDRGARAAYAVLRLNLGAGGAFDAIYRRELDRLLRWVDRFFDPEHPPAAPPPAWSAAAYNQCLLLALVYPTVSVFVIWGATGQIGTAEEAIGLGEIPEDWLRWGLLASIAVVKLAIGYSRRRTERAEGLWRALHWLVPYSDAGAVAVAVADGRGVADARAVAVANARAVVRAVAVAGAGAGAVAVAGAGAGAAAVAGAGAVLICNEVAKTCGWQARFLAVLTVVLSAVCLVSPSFATAASNWRDLGPLIVFFGLLTCVNAPFDWLSLGLTRFLLRRGLSKRNWWAPILYALIDATSAAVFVAVLAVACLLAVQAFEILCLHYGGPIADIMPVHPTLTALRDRPFAPENWWIYAMLFSTMIPSFVNMAVAGFSLLRTPEAIGRWLLSFLPDKDRPAPHVRVGLSLLLSGQWLLGGLLGAVWFFVVFGGVFWIVRVVFSAGLLDLALWLETLYLPIWVIRLFAGQ